MRRAGVGIATGAGAATHSALRSRPRVRAEGREEAAGDGSRGDGEWRVTGRTDGSPRNRSGVALSPSPPCFNPRLPPSEDPDEEEYAATDGAALTSNAWGPFGGGLKNRRPPSPNPRLLLPLPVVVGPSPYVASPNPWPEGAGRLRTGQRFGGKTQVRVF